MRIEKSVTLYDVDVEIELDAYEVAQEFSSTSDMEELLDDLRDENIDAVKGWVRENASNLGIESEAKKLTDHQKSHLSAAVLVLTALQNLTGKDYAETIRVLLNIENDMEVPE